MNKKKIYLFPEFNRQIGYGHLKRLINVYNIVQQKFRTKFLLYDNKPNGFELPYIIVKDDINKIINDAYYLIVDFRYYVKEFIEQLNKKLNLVIFDSASLFKSSDYETIYINITTPIKYNELSYNQFVYDDISFYPLPEELQNRTKIRSDTVLISFGNSDPNHLTEKVISNISNDRNKYFVTIGDFFNKKYVERLKYIIEKRKNFKIVNDYYKYFLRAEKVITSYGLTFIEALIKEKKIALFNNSRYHTHLSKNFPNMFFYIGTNKITAGFLLNRRIEFFINKYNNSYTLNYTFFKDKFLSMFGFNKFIKKRKCPICSSNNIKLILNNKNKRISECKKCGTKFQYDNIDVKSVYNEEYFTKKYEKQYGNTYINDRNNIVKLAKERLKIIKKISKKFDSILDIGCAYGFFLDEAKKYFKNVKGIEINKEAVKYGRKVLSLDIDMIDIMKFKSNSKYDVITLWYVFEHFKYPNKVINKIRRMLNYRGMVCLAIPNGSGALYKFNRRLWIKLHPDDHCFDYSLRGIKNLMKKNGFKLIRYRITGIHPERVGIKIKYKILNFFFMILKLGDTMELYFRYQ